MKHRLSRLTVDERPVVASLRESQARGLAVTFQTLAVTIRRCGKSVNDFRTRFQRRDSSAIRGYPARTFNSKRTGKLPANRRQDACAPYRRYVPIN